MGLKQGMSNFRRNLNQHPLQASVTLTQPLLQTILTQSSALIHLFSNNRRWAESTQNAHSLESQGLPWMSYIPQVPGHCCEHVALLLLGTWGAQTGLGPRQHHRAFHHPMGPEKISQLLSPAQGNKPGRTVSHEQL